MRFLLWLPALGWMSLLFYLSSKTGPGGPEWQAVVFHLVAYAWLAAWYWLALRGTEIPPRYLALVVIFLAMVYGISDEVHQSFTPGRMADPMDVLVDTIGAAGAAAVLYLVTCRSGLRGLET